MPSDRGNYALVFQNTRREKENDPQYTGNGEIACPYCGNVAKYWVSGWKKISQKAGDFLSLTFRQKEERQKRQEPVPFDRDGGW